jgi:hypothetical protein
MSVPRNMSQQRHTREPPRMSAEGCAKSSEHNGESDCVDHYRPFDGLPHQKRCTAKTGHSIFHARHLSEVKGQLWRSTSP